MPVVDERERKSIDHGGVVQGVGVAHCPSDAASTALEHGHAVAIDDAQFPPGIRIAVEDGRSVVGDGEHLRLVRPGREHATIDVYGQSSRQRVCVVQTVVTQQCSDRMSMNHHLPVVDDGVVDVVLIQPVTARKVGLSIGVRRANMRRNLLNREGCQLQTRRRAGARARRRTRSPRRSRDARGAARKHQRRDTSAAKPTSDRRRSNLIDH